MSLDPEDWSELRALGHRMLDDMVDHLATLRDRPAWQPQPDQGLWHQPLPQAPRAPASVYEQVRRDILPYSVGNLHPGFMGWVHGGGTAIGMLAELLAGGLNANCGGRNHAPIDVERQVVRWAAEMLGFPADAAGLLVTGTSVANLIAVLVARRAALGASVRSQGLKGAKLVAYASEAAHGCVPRAIDMAGLGTDALRAVPVGPDGGMDIASLAAGVAEDRTAGLQPFLVVGTAGSVDTGAIDDLAGLATFCRAQALCFHVDAAFGALAMLSPAQRPLLHGIQFADSVAFDFHKWAQVPYDAGCILMRDPARALDAFAQDTNYLRREARGLAGGQPWPCDLGPDLSRGFRALKVWMTLSTYGTDALGEVIARCCALAGQLGAAVAAQPALELLAPVRLNIVCFRVRALDDAGNANLVIQLQEGGQFLPSTTRVAGRLAIRAAIVNHRTASCDIDGLVRAVLTQADIASA